VGAQESIDWEDEHHWSFGTGYSAGPDRSGHPRASLDSDWFSSDDAIYDEMTDPAAG
jgi:hypothetical protein